ncbi:MAG TPA: lipoyl(octanoyl) transferase LipB [Burkholderiales bacterium]
MTLVEDLVLKSLGTLPYAETFQAMKDFTDNREESTADELWIVEHPPVYTLGQGAAVPEIANGIPLVQSDRGGEITYHGPGQAVVYTLVDLARRRILVRQFVRLLEQSVIDLLGANVITGERKAGAPGVYVDGAKIAALGIRVRRGRAYHGVALNVDMDLSPFSAIDPCGYPGLPVTQMKDLGFTESTEFLGQEIAKLIVRNLGDA